MRRAVFLVAATVVSCLAALSGGTALAQDEGSTIRGAVFHDLDGDGIRDAGEPGLPMRDVLLDGGREVTREDGTYAFDAGPGEHTVSVELDQIGHPCVGPPLDAFSFDPIFFLNIACVDVTNPWDATTPQPATVNVSPGQTIEVDFGLQPVDVVTMAGYAILEDDFAPPGTVIEARFEGTECGRTEARPGTFNMRIEVYGAGERPGCPMPNDLVGFLIGGVSTGSEVRWVPFTETANDGGYLNIGLVAIEQHAWYWTQPFVDVPPPDGTVVQAIVGGTVCGEATTTAHPIGQGSLQHIVGFSRLIVPSDDIQPGCGRPDATVSFRMDGEEVGSVPWQPGLQQVSLDLGEAFAPTPGLPIDGYGGGPTGGRERSLAAIAALVVAGLFALGAGGLAARRR